MCDTEKVIEIERTAKYPAELPESFRSSVEEPVDLLPEFCVYTDEGCSLASACLNCPFPQCVQEMPWGKRKQAVADRNAEIVSLFNSKKISPEELAIRFKVSKRTIFRALAKKEK